MSAFTEFEAFERIRRSLGFSKTYRLTAPLSWEIGCKGSGWLLTVPSGRDFDISVPGWLEWALSPYDRRVLPAAAIHDELINLGHDAAFASAEFRRAVIARGVRPWFGWLLFVAVFVWTVVLSPQHEAPTS